MSQLTTQQTFDLAVRHHQAGRLREAEQLYRQVLAQQPGHADALHYLGVIAHQVGRIDLALDLMRQAIARNPNSPEAYGNLGNALRDGGRFDDAIAAYRQAIAFNPNYPEAHCNLGIALKGKGQFDDAIAACRQAIAFRPNYPEAYNNLGIALKNKGRFDDAVAAYRQTIALRPNYPEAHFNLGIALRDKGQLDEAIAAYRQAVALRPRFPEAYSNLGIALIDRGQLDEAIIACRQAIALNPNIAEAHCNLGIALKDKGQLDETIAAYRKAIALRPNYAEAHTNLGIALKEKGQLDDAVAAYRQAIAFRPDFAEAHSNLGNALRDKGQLDGAVAAYRQAVAFRPNLPETHNNLGIALTAMGQLDEAIAAFHEALAFQPSLPEAHNNLANVLKSKGQLDDAIAAYQRAIALRPNFSEAHNNLGTVLKDKGQLDDAIAAYRQAVASKPSYAEAHNNLGVALKETGRLDEAVAAHRTAIALKPDYADAHSNLLFAMQYHLTCDASAIAEEQRRWNRQHAEPLRKFIPVHTNDRDPDRRLRIGYVSPDFRDHVVGQNLLPLLRQHDHKQFEFLCYAQVFRPDAITSQFQQNADGWRDIIGLSDEQVAQQIREDRIDILVDLALHMGHNRLLVFARKPAPVQVTFAGYPGSTGLEAIDYRLTDPYLDPPNMDESIYSEKTIRLPDSFWCYDPLENRDIAVNSLPALQTGVVTFGCLNNFCKINEQVLQLWAQVLKSVDRSRLLILCPEGSHRQALLDLLQREGIHLDRIELVGRRPRAQYLELYHRIDVGLDTFPYNGHTTSLDSFWMGVPVVTLVGLTVVGRAGVSQLSNLGLTELIAKTSEQYMQIAAALAGDLPRLSELRRALRSRMQASPLMDAAKFARNIETAYRQMWRTWCRTASARNEPAV